MAMLSFHSENKILNRIVGESSRAEQRLVMVTRPKFQWDSFLATHKGVIVRVHQNLPTTEAVHKHWFEWLKGQGSSALSMSTILSEFLEPLADTLEDRMEVILTRTG